LLQSLGFSSQELRASTFPAVIQDFVPFVQFLNQRSENGPDGNNRFIWDYVDLNTHTYSGSALWILDPAGNVVASGNAIVPGSVGGFGLNYSNIALHVSSTNNTTLAFAFGLNSNNTAAAAFGTWTCNDQGNLIAASGPTGFDGLQIVNIAFSERFLSGDIPAVEPESPRT
jgi:hypothetical protein